MKMPRLLYLVCGIFIFCFAGSCDRTVLFGEISSDRSVARVNETVTLRLTFPLRFEEAYGIMWKAIPSETAEVKYTEADPYYKKSKDKLDRVAYFNSTKPGKYEVQAYGFFKQTNPQFIDKVIIEVVD